MPANRSKNAPGPWRQSASGVGQTWQILPPTTQITTFSPRLLYRQPGSISSSAWRTCPQKRSLLHPPTTTLEVSSAFPRERAYLLRISSSQSSSSSSQSSSSRVHHRLRSSRTHDAPSSPRRTKKTRESRRRKVPPLLLVPTSSYFEEEEEEEEEENSLAKKATIFYEGKKGS